METRINYFALLIVITVGVAAGNLISNWITAKYIDAEVEKETIEISKVVPVAPPKQIAPANTQETIKLSPNISVESKAIENPVNQEQLIEQRKLDEIGIRLAKTCNEWTVAHKDMHTQTSERGMNKHCAEYYDYLSFGNLPNSE